MKQFLKEEIAPRQMRLVESSQDSNNSHCLGTMYGPCADFNHPTRNGNFYSKKLWENVFKDDIVKESLMDRILIGELDHPETRLETKATNACIVMTDYEFHDDEGLLYGKFDILPTPNGRILKSLIDCGCKIGVSSRGEGDVTVETIEDYDGEVNKVDEDNYEFVAFDAVVLPAVKAAKPSLQESLNHTSLKESLQKEVDSATTVSELEVIKDVVEATNLPDADSLLESVKNKSQELSNGTTSSSALIEDLEKANETIQSLNGEIDRLKEDITTSKSQYKKSIKLRQKVISESIKSKKELNSLKEKYNSLVFKSAFDCNETEDSLKSSYQKVSKLESKVSALTNDFNSIQRKYERLKRRSSIQINQLTTSYERRIKELEESLRQSQQLSKEKIQEIKSLKSKLNDIKDESSQKLTESASRSKKLSEKYQAAKSELDKAKSENQKFIKAYIIERCKSCRIDSNLVLESIKSDTTIKEADKIIEKFSDKAQRYSSMSITNDPLINMLQESTVRFSQGQMKEDKELEQTVSFMEKANKLF